MQCIDLLPELPVAISEEERYSISDLDQVSYATVSDDDISEEERFNFGL